MVLRIDPRYPLVWRSPTSLQVGASVARVVFEELSHVDERLIAALSVGVTRPGLAVIARACGADESSVPALLGQLAPVLAAGGEPATSDVTVVGTGLAVSRIAEALADAGHRVRITTDPVGAAATPCDLAIAVGHYVLAPELHGLWLRRDIPHLAVLFTDSGASISQIVEPGSGPCLYCLQLQLTDDDPAWPAISAQLWGRRSTTETALLSDEVAGIVCRSALARLERRHAASAHHSVDVDAVTGATTETPRGIHPNCGCAQLRSEADGPSAAARPGSDWPDAVRAGTSPRSSRPSPPTTGSAFAEPA